MSSTRFSAVTRLTVHCRGQFRGAELFGSFRRKILPSEASDRLRVGSQKCNFPVLQKMPSEAICLHF
eukprot:1210441-Pyramimonas_sp.AAC.1